MSALDIIPQLPPILPSGWMYRESKIGHHGHRSLFANLCVDIWCEPALIPEVITCRRAKKSFLQSSLDAVLVIDPQWSRCH
jgi:hypothetical protein